MYPTASNLTLPLTPYETGDFLHFGQKIRRHFILWATHLGDDVVASPGTSVAVVGDGQVVLSQMRQGSAEKRNWGGVVIIGHSVPKSKIPELKSETLFSVYGHLNEPLVQAGDAVEQGQVVGTIAAGHTPQNGWWKHPHLHFGLYTGPWDGTILPGYKRPEERRTKRKWWHEPRQFISQYNAAGATG